MMPAFFVTRADEVGGVEMESSLKFAVIVLGQLNAIALHAGTQSPKSHALGGWPYLHGLTGRLGGATTGLAEVKRDAEHVGVLNAEEVLR